MPRRGPRASTRKTRHLQPNASDDADAEGCCFAFCALASHIRALSKSGEKPGRFHVALQFKRSHFNTGIFRSVPGQIALSSRGLPGRSGLSNRPTALGPRAGRLARFAAAAAAHASAR